MGPKQMSAEERAKVFKALSDPRRLEIVDRLARGSLCGTDLADSLGISLALLCHHWEVLVDAGILQKERQGQLRVCSLDVQRLQDAMTLPQVSSSARLGLPAAPVKRKSSAKTKAPKKKRRAV
jgi:DNA-binding transcriptional ArsR family regulator